jgi:low affinity Fe/Cu permease
MSASGRAPLFVCVIALKTAGVFSITNRVAMAEQPRKVSKVKLMFDHFSTSVTRVTGHPTAFLLAVVTIIVWATTGPIFHYSDTWQLVINTGTTIITFLMVFVIQQSQNKDVVALHLKLNELIAANKRASNRLIDIEDLTEEELTALKQFYIRLSELAEKDGDLFSTHSVDEAHILHKSKLRPHDKPALTEAPGNLHAGEHLDERNDELPEEA